MPPWVLQLAPLVMAFKGLWMLASTIMQTVDLSRQAVLLDLGPHPSREGRGMFDLFWLAVFGCFICGFIFGIRPWLEGASIATLMACTMIASLLTVRWRMGLLEEGMLVPTRFLGFRSQAYFPWSEIRAYTWNGTDLILNPGWRQTTCVIPEEFVHDVEAILIDRCPLVGLDSLETH